MFRQDSFMKKQILLLLSLYAIPTMSMFPNAQRRLFEDHLNGVPVANIPLPSSNFSITFEYPAQPNEKAEKPLPYRPDPSIFEDDKNTPNAPTDISVLFEPQTESSTKKRKKTETPTHSRDFSSSESSEETFYSKKVKAAIDLLLPSAPKKTNFLNEESSDLSDEFSE